VATYWQEGILSSVRALQVAAAAASNPDWIARANDLQQRLQTQIFPPLQSLLIKGDALKLGQEIAAATGAGVTDPNDPNSTTPNILYLQDTTVGGPVGTPQQEAFSGGDVGANLSAFGSDLSSSARELASASFDASKYVFYAAAALLALYVAVIFRR
jgi:hypothetical protein